MTTIQHLYKKDINRPLNPAVSADDFSAATIQTEIDEYVFTDEIINGLYQVLHAIWTQNVSHNGIWINGFFGSGKSHFLKYLGYCINPQHREAALQRLKQAVSERDPLLVPDSKSQVTIDDLKQLAAWIQKATIDVVLFNIGSVHNTNSDEKEVFTQVFWNQFNRFRGYNAFNLALAQNLEKVLDRAGVFATFKERLDAEGFNWNEQAAMLATVYLDHVLEVAKELLPALTVDSVRKAIMDNKENVSPEAFCSELKEFIDQKNDKNYRLLFLVDEVSQFISNREYLLLQLQEVVTGLHKYGNDKAWVACTAQQDLSQLMSNMQIVSTSEDYGKIMGRFEVRVSLKGTQTEYITQKRLLDKNETGREVLDKVWENNHLAIENQFTLPSSFHTYKDEEDFINYYPFVPYQFRLIMKVLDSFGHLRYIDSQSRGNERSIIKITHNTADKHKDDEVGQLISFDKFYNAMFELAVHLKCLLKMSAKYLAMVAWSICMLSISRAASISSSLWKQYTSALPSVNLSMRIMCLWSRKARAFSVRAMSAALSQSTLSISNVTMCSCVAGKSNLSGAERLQIMNSVFTTRWAKLRSSYS